MQSSPRTGPIFSRPQQAASPQPPRPITPPAPRPASPAAGNLAEYLCGRLADPPRSDFDHRAVTEAVELRFGRQSLRGTTSYVGWRKLEICTTASIDSGERVSIRLSSGQHPWSTAVVARSVETTEGWKVELTFTPTQPQPN